MNNPSLRRFVCTATLGIVASVASVSAHAGDVRWSVGIDAPFYPASVRTMISNAPHAAWYPPPRVFLPPQRHVAGWPRPVYDVDAPVHVRPHRPGYHRHAPIRRGHWKHHRHHDDCDD